MAKKQPQATNLLRLGRCNAEKISIITKLNLYGQVGGTTELLGVVNLLHAIGLDPVLISADPTSQILREVYGQRDSNGELESMQGLGEGVVEIDLEDKDGSLLDVILDSRIADRDIVIDSKGGVYSSVVAMYPGGLDEFFAPLEWTHRFINIDCMTDLQKSFDNLDAQYAEFNKIQSGMEIHLVRVFSLGKTNGTKDRDKIIEKYKEWEATHPFDNPNIHVHKVLFNTSWSKPEVSEYFATKNIREGLKQSENLGQILAIAPQFLAERDKAWSQILFDASDVEEIAELPLPTPTRAPVQPKWGKTLIGPSWKNREQQ
jgi:hypothetical protein